MISQFTTSSFESIYEILPSSVDDVKIGKVSECILIWFTISFVCIGPLSLSIYSIFVLDRFLPLLVVYCIFLFFFIIFICSIYNLVLIRRYKIQLDKLKSLLEEEDEISGNRWDMMDDVSL
jgi:hypothetical protein